MIGAILFGGCADESHSSIKTETTTPRPSPKAISDYDKISIAKNYAYIGQHLLNGAAPDGVDSFSTVTFGSASIIKNGNVVVKGTAYGKDEYGRSVGRYTFEWEIIVTESGAAQTNPRMITFKKD